MPISTATAKDIVHVMALEFGIAAYREADLADLLAKRLDEFKVDDEDAERLYRLFRDGTPPDAQRVFHRLLQYIKENRKRVGHLASTVGACVYCGDCGLVTILAAVSEKGGLYAPDKLTPGKVWDTSPVYQTSVPCACSTGQRIGGLSASWKALRDRELDWAMKQEGSLVHAISVWQSKCVLAFQKRDVADAERFRAEPSEYIEEKARKLRAQAKQLQGEEAKDDGGEPGARDTDIENCREDDESQVAGRGSYDTGTGDRDRDAQIPAGAGDVRQELDGFDDVPEDEIPF